MSANLNDGSATLVARAWPTKRGGDLPLDLQLLDKSPTLKLTGDLSHYVVGGR